MKNTLTSIDLFFPKKQPHLKRLLGLTPVTLRGRHIYLKSSHLRWRARLKQSAGGGTPHQGVRDFRDEITLQGIPEISMTPVIYRVFLSWPPWQMGIMQWESKTPTDQKCPSNCHNNLFTASASTRGSGSAHMATRDQTSRPHNMYWSCKIQTPRIIIM
jgi:hypothetical protein